MRSAAWCFTLNNYTQDEYDETIKIVQDGRYYCIGKEIGEGGTPHLQGYVYFQRRYNFNVIKHKFGNRYHIEGANGSPRQNREYCSKGGDFTESGELPVHGGNRAGKTRDELGRQFMERLGEGNGGIAKFAAEHPGAFIFSGSSMLRNAQSLTTPVDRPNINVEWVYGKPGVGKSRYAHEKYPEAYIKEPRTKWWNGYLQEKEVIIDDFGPGGIDINHLLRWFDRYKCLVENKGGMVALVADKFIVTSNFHPRDIFKWGDEVNPQLPALDRRVSYIYME